MDRPSSNTMVATHVYVYSFQDAELRMWCRIEDPLNNYGNLIMMHRPTYMGIRRMRFTHIIG